MNNDDDRYTEIERSLYSGAAAFAAGAMLILVMSVTTLNAPAGSQWSGESLARADGYTPVEEAPAVQAVSLPRAAKGSLQVNDANDTGHIEVPFKANQSDVEPLPAQF